MKDNEIQQWKKCQMRDLIGAQGDGTIHLKLEGTYSSDTNIYWKHNQMYQLSLLLLCTCHLNIAISLY